MFKFTSIAPALLVALMAFCPVQTRANTIALSFTGGNGTGQGNNVTIGWAFSLSGSVSLTDLGLWDAGNNGLSRSYVVTIWDSMGMQVAQMTVPSGTSGTLVDGFRYVSLTTPTLLGAGNYTIGAFFPSGSLDNLTSGATTITTASGVTYNGSRSTAGNVFPSGNAGGGVNGYFGPNFQFGPAAVPDSGGTFPLALGSLAALFLLRRMRPQERTRAV